MKNLFIILLTLISITSCKDFESKTKDSNYTYNDSTSIMKIIKLVNPNGVIDTNVTSYNRKIQNYYEIWEIEGHWYVHILNSHSGWGAHAGNCPNSSHNK